MAVSFTVCEIAWKGSVSSLPVHHPPSEPVPACTRQRWDPLVVPRRSWCSDRTGTSRPIAARRPATFASIHRTSDEPHHRVAAHPQPLRDLRNGPTLPVKQPVNLCPILHFIHPFLLEPDVDSRVVVNHPPPRSFRPALSAQYSPVVDT